MEKFTKSTEKAKEADYKRYPGLPPFKRSQAALFCGRSDDISRLYNVIRVEPLVVLFGRSGTGKSSLLNAGLSPELVLNEFLPLSIRLQPVTNENNISNQNNTPKKLALEALAPFQDKIPFPPGYPNRKKANLWEAIKRCRFPFDAIPVLIFDQFEELFNSSKEGQREFLYELAEIVHPYAPNDALNWLSGIDIKDRTVQHIEWCKQPPLRVVVAIRSDRFFELNQWTGVLPGLLRSCVELSPLTVEKARRAILEPAETLKVLSPPYGPPFFYEKPALDTIVNRLSGGKNYVEPSYLQIICSELEDRLTQPDYTGDRTTVSEDDLSKQFNLNTIIESFYNKQLEKIKDESQNKIARELLEDELVTNNRRRLLMEDQVLEKLSPYGHLLQTLQDLRLIRGDVREGQPLYEISHDILLEAIGKSAEIRKLKLKAERDAKESAIKQERLKSRLEDEKKKREKEEQLAGELQKANEIANQARAEAEYQSTLAAAEAENAIKAQLKALIASEEAKRQREIAEVEAQNARSAERKARAAQEEAEWQREIAEDEARKATRRRNLFAAFLVICIFLTFIAVRLWSINRDALRVAKASLGISIIYNATEQFNKGKHRDAFRLYQAADRLAGGDTLSRILEKKVFSRITGAVIASSADNRWLGVTDVDKKLTFYENKNGEFVERGSRTQVVDFELYLNNLLIYNDTGKQTKYVSMNTNKNMDISDSLMHKTTLSRGAFASDTSKKIGMLTVSPDAHTIAAVWPSEVRFCSMETNKPMVGLNNLCRDLLRKNNGPFRQ